MKRRILFLSFILIIFITACSSKDEVTPNDRFDTYVKKWNSQEFAKMYDMLTVESKETYPAELFVDRYQKIYEDLGVLNLKVTYEKLSEEDLEIAMEEGTAKFPLTVEMESVAGPITFDYEATLVQVEEDEEEQNWFVTWDPGFIFPEIKDDGKISFQTEKPKRGEILDRNQMPLAINDLVYEIGIVPEKLGENAATIKKEAAKLLNMSVESIDEALNADWVKPNLFVPLKKVPTTKETILNQLWELGGIAGNKVTGRTYPSGKAAAHLVGYIGQITAEELEKTDPDTYDASDLIGKRGLEQLYEGQLKGEKGVKIIISKESEEDVILAEKPVKDGESISITIDINTQEKIYESYDGKAGSTAAIDPKTGETIALVSSPSFDPNELLYGISKSQWESLQDDPQKPLINRFAATFAPGSVIKPITAAIGLQNKTIIPNEGIKINGLTWDNGAGWGDYQVRRVSETNKPVDLADALIRSDNIYFAMQAVEMGGEAMVKGLKQFGFEESLPFEYPITTSTISKEGTLTDEVLLANTSYGQGQVELSALHLALAYTPFLNKGNMIKPTLLTSEETGQIWQEGLISSEHAELVEKILREVVTKGTAKVAQKANFPISGKTGTAELKSSSKTDGHENGWFVGYPTDDQDILIAMMIEEVEDIGASGYVAEQVTELLIEIK